MLLLQQLAHQVRRGYDTWNVDKSSTGAINTVFGRPAGTKALNGTRYVPTNILNCTYTAQSSMYSAVFFFSGPVVL